MAFVVQSELATATLGKIGWKIHKRTDDACIFKKHTDGLIAIVTFQRSAHPLWVAIKKTCDKNRWLSYQEFEDAYRVVYDHGGKLPPPMM